MNYKIIEIFNSIEGEGKRQGELCTFIRLAGCNLNCGYCDTKYSHNLANAKEYPLEEIFDFINKDFYSKNITITGGEPLMQDVSPLLDALISKNYEINIETNGSFSIAEYLHKNVFITLDYKLKNSKMEAEMLLGNWKYLRKEDVLKFVISDLSELETVRNLLTRNSLLCNIYLGFTQNINPVEIVKYMENHSIAFQNCKIQVQLHKVIGVK